MDYVYVVTFGKLGSETGEFFTETAFVNETDALESAITCMQQHGGRELYSEVYVRKAQHVVRYWNNPVSKVTVWLERLMVEGQT